MPRSLMLTFLAGAALLLAGVPGCEDPAAAQRSAAVAALEEATAEFSVIVAGPVTAGSEGFVERRDALGRLASRVNGIADPPGEKLAGKALLGSSIERELASLSLAETTQIENDLSRHRIVTRAMVDAAQRLDALAAARESLDLSGPRGDLDAQREEAEARRSEYSRMLADLDIPIAELIEAIQSDQADVDRLTDEANQLRRDAVELGPSSGFQHFERAIDRERDADQLEYRIAHRELDLDYELRPEHRIAGVRVNAAGELIDAVGISQEALDTYFDAALQDAATIRQVVDELGTRIRDRVGESRAMIEGGDGDDLEAAYARTLEHLGAASRHASRAASALPRDEAGGARMIEARVGSMLGHASWARMRGLDEQIELLDALLGAEGTIADVQAYGAWRQELMTRRTEALNQAREAYEQAQSAAGQASGRDAVRAVAEFGQSLEVTLAALSGEPQAMTLSLPTGETTAPTPPRSGGTSTQDATHEALIQRLLGLDPGTEASRAFLAACTTRTPGGEQAVAAMTRMNEAMVPIEEALTRKFGEGLSSVQGAMGGMPALEDLRLVTEDETSAVYAMQMRPGAPSELHLVREDDRWYVDFEKSMPGMDQMAPMFKQQADLMDEAAADFARRIDDGEFSSPMEAVMALMQALGADMGGGAMPGGG